MYVFKQIHHFNYAYFKKHIYHWFGWAESLRGNIIKHFTLQQVLLYHGSFVEVYYMDIK